MSFFVRAFVGLIVLLGSAWAAAAVWFDAGLSPTAANTVAAAIVVSALVVFVRVRPRTRALAVWGVGFGVVLAWWMSLQPSNERDWLPDVARLPRAEINGDIVTIENVRDFRYRTETDHTERWETRSYDLRDIRGLDLFLIYWGPRRIAHTILSWDFGDGNHLAVSIETRKEKGEEYSAVRGFFRQFEVYYVVADERDVVGLRTNYRGETVYLYRFHSTPQANRAIFVDYLREINLLAERPEWYNAFTVNCTTAARRHTSKFISRNGWDWRMLVNGYLDELAYEREVISNALPFAELRERSIVNERAQGSDLGEDFSVVIREGLPE